MRLARDDAPMLILGIDPGTATIGYGYVWAPERAAPEPRGYGVIQTAKGQSNEARLLVLFNDLHELLAHQRPDVMSVEELFFFRNVNTAMPVAQARGVILLAATQLGIPVVGYTPAQVKSRVAGHGRADKADVQAAVRDLLALDRTPKPDDAADALGLALTHWVSIGGVPMSGLA